MEKVLKYVYSKNGIKLTLKAVSYIATLIFVSAFFALLIVAFFKDETEAVKLLFAAGVPFILVTLVRKLIGAKRPYDVYDFYIEKPKSKKEASFPSRHVTSAFLISTLTCLYSVPLAISLFVIAISLAVSRVLLGLHFIRDVVAGALIGGISGALGILVLLI